MNNPLFFHNAGDERGTPQDFFDALDAEFMFTLDAAATTLNHKCDRWYGEGGIAFDALEQDWGGEVVFLNPPYSVAGAFVRKAREEANNGAVVVLLLPVRSDTRWWHSYVWDTSVHDWRPGVSARLLAGRLEFELTVPDDVRAYVIKTLGTADEEIFTSRLLPLSKETGLPKMALERIHRGLPDDCLLDSAPFPSCVLIFTAG